MAWGCRSSSARERNRRALHRREGAAAPAGHARRRERQPAVRRLRGDEEGLRQVISRRQTDTGLSGEVEAGNDWVAAQTSDCKRIGGGGGSPMGAGRTTNR